jgi:ribosomal protein L11 methyltransferase
VLDVGTGSGVLAIAAARIFRTNVIAGDIDRQAVTAARSNVRINRAAGFVTALRATGTRNDAITRRAPYDLIVANILLGPLTRLAVPLARLSRAGAIVVLSGLLPEHANAALAFYRAQGLALERRLVLDGWATLVLQKRRRPGRGDPGRRRR